MVDQLTISVRGRLEAYCDGPSDWPVAARRQRFVASVNHIVSCALPCGDMERRCRKAATELSSDLEGLWLQGKRTSAPTALYPRPPCQKDSVFRHLDGDDTLHEIFSRIPLKQLGVMGIVSSRMRWRVQEYLNVATSLTVRTCDEIAPIKAAHTVDSLPALRTLKVEGDPMFPEMDLAALSRKERFALKSMTVPAALYLGMALAKGDHTVRLSDGSCVRFADLRSQTVLNFGHRFLSMSDVAVMLGPLRHNEALHRITLGGHNIATLRLLEGIFSWPMREEALGATAAARTEAAAERAGSSSRGEALAAIPQPWWCEHIAARTSRMCNSIETMQRGLEMKCEGMFEAQLAGDKERVNKVTGDFFEQVWAMRLLPHI